MTLHNLSSPVPFTFTLRASLAPEQRSDMTNVFIALSCSPSKLRGQFFKLNIGNAFSLRVVLASAGDHFGRAHSHSACTPLQTAASWCVFSFHVGCLTYRVSSFARPCAVRGVLPQHHLTHVHPGPTHLGPGCPLRRLPSCPAPSRLERLDSCSRRRLHPPTERLDFWFGLSFARILWAVHRVPGCSSEHRDALAWFSSTLPRKPLLGLSLSAPHVHDEISSSSTPRCHLTRRVLEVWSALAQVDFVFRLWELFSGYQHPLQVGDLCHHFFLLVSVCVEILVFLILILADLIDSLV